MAAVVFVTLRARYGELISPQFGDVFECLRVDVGQDGVRNSDWRNQDLTAMSASRHQQVTRLLAKKRDGFFGLDRRAHHRAGRAVDPAGQINGNDRSRLRVHRLDHRLRQAADRAIQAGAKQGVDDEVGIGKSIGLRRCNLAAPCSRGSRGVAFQFV